MKDYPGTSITIFLLFFGISALDAIRGGSLFGILFWLAVGALFAYADLRRVRSRRG